MNLGRPSVFLRLAGCNLSCAWCDTRYAWDWRQFDKSRQTAELAVEEAARLIASFPCRNLVVTGGEPLLQQAGLVSLLRSLPETSVEVETNGTIAPGAKLAALVSQWNVSPKLASSGNPERKREVPAVLGFFAGQDNAYFKFTVRDRRDYAEVQRLAARHGVPAARVVLMPEGATAAALTRRSRWLADLCLAGGYRFSTRLQVLLWRNQRGR